MEQYGLGRNRQSNPKIHFLASRYLSLARTANTYRELIAHRYEVVPNLDQAEVVILHLLPHEYSALCPSPQSMAGKYVIACCVWEASELPRSYERALAHIQEIWACSRYCCNIFQKHHPKVVYMPYAIDRDLACSNADRAFVRDAMAYEPGCYYYLAVTRVSDKRKNVEALVRAFRRQQLAMPKARLVIKAFPGELAHPSWPTCDHIILLRNHMTDSQINALYELTDVYISAHHSEAWGLTLSDAMLFQKPVIATGYSGNLEFMNENNSFLIDFEETHIRREDCFYLFHDGMKWAYPNEQDTAEKLLLLYKGCNASLIAEKVGNAFRDIERFRRLAVARRLHQRLTEIAETQL